MPRGAGSSTRIHDNFRNRDDDFSLPEIGEYTKPKYLLRKKLKKLLRMFFSCSERSVKFSQ